MDPASRARRQPSPSNPFATPAAAGALAVLLVALVAAIVLIPGMLPGASPSASALATCAASGSASPACSAEPTASAPASPTASPLPSFVRPTPTPAPTLTRYVVRSGDTLTSIAKSFQTSARSIAWWNRGTYPTLDPESEGYAPNHIELGWVLQVMPGVVVDELNPPTPSPGAPTPQPSGSGGAPSNAPTAIPATGSPAAVITNGPRGTSQIALTFDMGGRLDPAVDIVHWLIDHDIHATLFPTGLAGTTTTQGVAALQLAATRPDLFVLGNHSWDHPNFTTLTAAQMANELTATETAIHNLLGRSTKPYFRPPYGAWTYAVRAGVGAAGWSRVMMWDVDTIDWKSTADGGPTAADIVTKVLTNAQGGSIVLMHLGGYHTLEALPNLLAGLQSRSLVPVTLTEMLGA